MASTAREQTTDNTQSAPYPAQLAALVASCTYRPQWRLYLDTLDRGQGSVGLTLTVLVQTDDSYEPHNPIRVRHLFPVPPAAYNRQSWQHWLFEQLLEVERHEAMEFFEIDGVKIFSPNHGPGWNPYLITELITDVDRRTDFRGEVQPA
jgi:hypothetical protein